MKKMLLTMLLPCLLLVSAWGQERVVTGKVTAGEDSSPIPGVNVVVQGTSKGTTTDVDGNYSIGLAQGENTLVYTFVGFKTQTVDVTNRTSVDIVMESDVTSLNEVVVVGYGEQRKADITGAIANVKSEEITKQPTVNPISALQGKVAGVQITNSGAPGASPQIRIRGLGTVYGNPNPLYVVDGVWYNDISFLNPNDIASLSVLKDASSQAIYGVRAANGVVLITTKKGTQDQAATVTYSGFVGSQIPTNQIEMATGPQYEEMINELDIINGGVGRYDTNYSDAGTTDWYRQILRAAMISSHQVSLSGATEKTNYNFSIGYLKQEGVVETNDFKRYTARLQNEFQALKFLRLGYTMTGAYNLSNDVPGGIFHEMYSALPNVPVRYADDLYGDPNDYKSGSSTMFNPQVTLDYFDQDSKNYRVTGSAFAEAKFLDYFTFRTSFGGDFAQNQSRNYTPEYVATLAQRNTTSRLALSRGEERNWIFENTLTYDRQLNDHSIKFLVGMGAQRYKTYFLNGNALNVPNNSRDDHFLTLGDPDTRFVEDGGDLSTVASYFGRLNYAFKDRYLVTASLRADGSSKFSKDERWAYLPSIGLGWVLTEESFLSGQNIFSSLKLRGSWGQIGNSAVPSNISTLTVTPYTYIGGDGTVLPAASIDRIVPPTTVWEKGVGTDVGLEATFLDGKLFTEIDYYIKDTRDAIFDIPILSSLGTQGNAIIGNQATFRNSGFEFSVNWNDQRSSDFSYTIGVNFSTNKNEVFEVATGRNPIEQGVGVTGGARNTRTIVGQPIGQFYGYRVTGIFQTPEEVTAYTSGDGTIIQPAAKPGDFKYADINGDGQISGKDKVVLGNPNPKYLYGINTSFRYKMFDLSLDFQGVAGVDIYNANLGFRFGTENFTREFYENRWHGAGTSNRYPSANIGGGNNYVANSFYVESGSYFRIRTAQIGFTFPSSLTNRWRMSSLRIYANAQNALNIFKYRGMNPEVGGTPTRAGVDSSVYPLYATYNFGLNVSF
jgi:TonB-linked SusC/RagA family outer membrane protein